MCARGHLPAWTGIWQRKKTSYVPLEPSLYSIYYLTWKAGTGQPSCGRHTGNTPGHLARPRSTTTSSCQARPTY